MENNENSTKIVWSHDATLALIAAVESRYDDLFHIHKKKHFWNIVAEELCSNSFDFSEKTCAKKWENLVRTYKNTKDKKKKTGTGPTRFSYFDRIDDLLGDSPSNTSPHSIDVHNKNTDETLQSEDSMLMSAIHVENDENLQPTKKPRKNPNMEYVKLKTDYYKKKEEGQQRRENQMEHFMEENIQCKKEKIFLLNKKLQLEERKIIALEKIAALRDSSN